ncbi:hypothetical protein [Aliarcobacter thereius]|uniref:Uncharacterized protein n=1 Tax=Aliarcobacter thereius LMG 24486 TaxID=1032240 RepID=A0A1C7WPT6_9BACT|nr:hypothetical protein [Aliarcobacter thereius]OCL92450.1 hypothetical protein AAX27_01228 [Aliarcobacter thereius]OCL95761.1 hypothetical protein AA347_01241 [Aliarcobacter thereius LMG 24486]QBF16264.1 hypothetical protein ATH_1212 [Aliarcobacter thereius LMG 24486]TLS92113.1 hypothetical protein FE244_06835 [Aliarcobacter thereius]
MAFNNHLKVIITLILISIPLFAKTYSKEDWKIYKGCKDKVYNKIDNIYDKKVCKYMLDDKVNLKTYGAKKMYNYYVEKLYYFK